MPLGFMLKMFITQAGIFFGLITFDGSQNTNLQKKKLYMKKNINVRFKFTLTKTALLWLTNMLKYDFFVYD